MTLENFTRMIRYIVCRPSPVSSRVHNRQQEEESLAKYKRTIDNSNSLSHLLVNGKISLRKTVPVPINDRTSFVAVGRRRTADLHSSNADESTRRVAHYQGDHSIDLRMRSILSSATINIWQILLINLALVSIHFIVVGPIVSISLVTFFPRR
jgi:hypothetical protein